MTFNRTADQLERLLDLPAAVRRRRLSPAPHAADRAAAAPGEPGAAPAAGAAAQAPGGRRRDRAAGAAGGVPSRPGAGRRRARRPGHRRRRRRSSPGGWTRGHRWPRRRGVRLDVCARPGRCGARRPRRTRADPGQPASPTPSPPRRRAGRCNSRRRCGRPRQVEVSVTDEGPGLSPEQRARAFDRFWRAPGSATGSGFGLGLAIARRLAETSGGSVELDSARDGRGLQARVRLPAAAARPELDPLPAPNLRPTPTFPGRS